MWNDNSISTKNISTIKSYIECRSPEMLKYIIQNEKTSSFILWYKPLTHSDLTTRGKRKEETDGFEKNLLYYLSEKDMLELQKAFPEKKFERAKQSNIGMPDSFYSDLGIPRIKRRKGKQTENHKWIFLNDYMQVFLVNETLRYFSLDYTNKIFNVLDKEMPSKWLNNYQVNIESGETFTPIELREAIHGLGTESDTVFHSLRLNMFLNDTIIFLIEKNQNENKLFILLEKNPKFFSLVGIHESEWMESERIRRFRENMLIKEGLVINSKENIYESEWDNVLLP